MNDSYIPMGAGSPYAYYPNDISGSLDTSGVVSIATATTHLPNTGAGSSDSGGFYVVILVMVGLMAVAFIAAAIQTARYVTDGGE